jgi:hypothetical protein
MPKILRILLKTCSLLIVSSLRTLRALITNYFIMPWLRCILINNPDSPSMPSKGLEAMNRNRSAH